jgi:phosphoglycolate phosphatase
MTHTGPVLVLWDIDRTLLYVGDIDRQVYREAFAEVVGRPAVHLPARGTGVTMPLAIQGLLRDNDVPDDAIPELLPQMVDLIPRRLAAHIPDLQRDGILMPGAVDALRAVHDHPHLLPSIVTGNLRENALIKLSTFDLDRYVDTEIGGYASDDAHRPALVGVAQKRAQGKHGAEFTRSNTVIIGDSLEDVRTGVEGGAAVIGVASGKTSADELADAGADVIVPDLTDVRDLLRVLTSLTSAPS